MQFKCIHFKCRCLTKTPKLNIIWHTCVFLLSAVSCELLQYALAHIIKRLSEYVKIRGGADSTVMRADANADSEVTHNKSTFFWGSGLNGQEQHDYKTPEFLVQTPPWVSHIHSNQAYQGQGQGKFICHIHIIQGIISSEMKGFLKKNTA